MRIYGTFKDKNNNNISVNIYNINKTGADVNIDTCDWIRFSDEPVIITTDCEDSFTHIIKKQCKIELISKRWLGDYLFANNATSIVVNVKRQVNNKIECLFAGFVTPCTYNQDYANAWEKITINCIDNLGVMEYRSQTDESTWADLKARSAMRTFKYLLEKMKLNDTTINIGNLPNTQYAQAGEMEWVETTYERKVDTDGNITYYAVETNVKILDTDTAVTTTETRTGNELTPTYIQSDDVVFVDGTPHYKKYAWLEINGELVKTNDYIIGDVATDLLPTVVDTINVLDGWTYGAHQMPFEYYEHFRIDNEMSDGSIARGSNDTIGDRIPEKPQHTTLGSFFEFRQGDADDLYEDDDQRGKYYYKNYAWVIMEFDNKSWQFKTGDWRKGRPYIQEPENGGELTPNNP